MTSCFTRFLPRFRDTDQAGQSCSTASRSSFHLGRFRPTLRPRTRNNRASITSTLDAMTIDTEDTVPPRKKQKTKESDTHLTCRICRSRVGDAYLKPCRRCRQPTCYTCIKGLFAAAMSDHERMPIRCCGHVVYHNVLRDLVPQSEVDRYVKRYDEASTSNPFYCPVPTCSAFIPPRVLQVQMNHDRITCDSCSTTSCVKCKQVATSEHKCGPQDDRNIILKSFQYKICPKCGTGVMRMFGCAHVRCMCGSHWCWDCQRPINACYANPCSRAREDGETSQAGDTDTEESDSEVDALPSNEHQPQSVNFAPLRDQLEDQHAAEPDAAIQANPGTLFDASATNAQTTGDEEAHARTHGTSAEQNSSQDSAIPTKDHHTGVSEEPVKCAELAPNDHSIPQPAEAIMNLDDPDGDEDWEGGDLDFGSEPADEEWDIWGCLHHFNKLDQDNISSKWLFDQSKEDDFRLECMGCFRAMGHVKGKKQRELDRHKRIEDEIKEQRKTHEDEIKSVAALQRKTQEEILGMMEPAETLVSLRRRRRRDTMSGASSAVHSDGASMTDTSVKHEKASKSPTDKKAAYDCRECGVLFCWHCRKGALKKVKKWKRDADSL